MTREEAVEAIERMKTIRPTCDACERMPFFGHTSTRMLPEGFEVEAHRAGYVKRCDACANGKTYPWADQLDPVRVAVFASSDPRCADKAFLLELLKETL